MRFNAAKLKSFTSDIMQKAGLDQDSSNIFAESLVNADMRGISSHGMTRLTAYSRRIRDGLVSKDTEIKIVQDNNSLLLIDGQNGMGAVTAQRAMELCVERAEKNGCCFAAVKGGNHFGYAAFFTEYAASKGMIGVAIANGPVALAPIGGMKPMLGTNPISISIPANRHHPMVLDMATSIVARGKITLAKKEGRTIPDNWGVDEQGYPTNDPSKVYAMLPFGGAKGYAISLITEILCSCLSGALNGQTMGSFYDYTSTQQSGFFLGAFNVGSIIPIDIFKENVDELFDSIKQSPKAPGVSEIMIAGEIEFNNYEQASKEGVQLSEAVVAELLVLSTEYGVPFECEFSQ
ncbi:MAG: Malate/L-lactate dehydrogenase [Bacillota bacterium]|jgi:LDH2 family malate/lactate/ureidoglycolate dehydrogenase|nr:Malate/L-lactate dehydrogenase [Bacillota bacterium]